MFVGAGLAGCSTIVLRTYFQESVPFPHHSVVDCLQNLLFSLEKWSNLGIKQKLCQNGTFWSALTDEK